MRTTVTFLFALVPTILCYISTPPISKIDGLRLEFLQLEESLWDTVFDYYDNLIKVTSSPSEGPEVELIKKFQEFGDVLQKDFPNDLIYGLETIENVYVWAKTYAELRGVYALYESFRRFQILQTTPGRVPSPQQAWLDLTQTLLQTGKSSIMQAQMSVTEFITREHLYEEALKETQGDMLCSTNQSAQQLLYNLYNTIELTELKGYMMMQFSYMLLKLYGKGNYTKEAQLMRDRYEERTVQSVNSIKKAMEKSSREFWKCDPPKHISGTTYVEVTQLLQGYVQNEVDLNPKGTCSESCAEYTYTKSHSCYKNLYCRQQRRCNGKIINCRFVDSDMWVCPADTSTNRRYEYIEYENGRILGRKQGCQKGTIKVDSWWRWLFWHCSYCFCLCDEQGIYSDRYFNMRSAIADIANNRVVTGLRFTKNNRIIHLQIQEGKLLPQGAIDQSTIRWVPVEDYKITDRYIYNGQDYHTLTWEQRSIDLDDLIADEQHLLTGVRFKKIGTHLNFEIYITPFDFEKGVLLEPLQRSIWKDNINTDVSLNNPRTQVYMVDPDIPTRIPTPSRPDSRTDQYIDFTHTDINRDAAQTTVPFLDAQPVVPKLAVPLAGAGLFHKGIKNSGGFIAPKIITYDYSSHLHPMFPKDELEINK